MPAFENAYNILNYHEYGGGNELLLAFHGFGMTGTQFRVLERAFGKKYTIVSFDLFFHGNTILKEDSVKTIRKGLQPAAFAEQIDAFMKERYPHVDKFSLLSYSMGTRMALCLIQDMPQRIANTYLIAPDGIEPNRLLAIGGTHYLVNRIFHQLVYSPRLVNGILLGMYKLGYIDDALLRILRGEFATTEDRLNSYKTITYYGSVVFDRKALATAINKHGIVCHLYFGMKDKLFPATIGERFAALLEHGKIHVFDDGHELVDERMNTYIERQLEQYD